MPYELGVKFKSDIDGFITGIRFYKGPANSGTHLGNLWTGSGPSAGTLLATAVFANETTSGWQQVSFGTPVPITANTVYVASYHTNVGGYAFDAAYFTNTGVDSPPLHALASNASGGNGVFTTGGTASRPARSTRTTTGSTWCSRRACRTTAAGHLRDQDEDDRQFARDRDLDDRRAGDDRGSTTAPTRRS